MHAYLILTKLWQVLLEKKMSGLIWIVWSGYGYNNIANNPKSQWPDTMKIYFCPLKTSCGPAISPDICPLCGGSVIPVDPLASLSQQVHFRKEEGLENLAGGLTTWSGSDTWLWSELSWLTLANCKEVGKYFLYA